MTPLTLQPAAIPTSPVTARPCLVRAGESSPGFGKLLRKALRLLVEPARRRLVIPQSAASPTKLRVAGYSADRRTRELVFHSRRLDDRAIEAKWRARVAVHPVERRRLGFDRPYVRESLSQFMRRQAD